jgi:hypothetical protein
MKRWLVGCGEESCIPKLAAAWWLPSADKQFFSSGSLDVTALVRHCTALL